MLVRELSAELNISNKELIGYLKKEGYSVASHMQKLTDEMIEKARTHFSKIETKETVEEVVKEKAEPKKIEIEISTKKFMPDDLILCKSVCPWKLNALGADRKTVYHWEYYGAEEYVRYYDIQSWRRKNIITQPKILIMDSDLCYQWRKELGETYKLFLDVEYPEEFFDLSDDKFESLLKNAPNVLKEVIRVTCLNMVRNENYPDVKKIKMIDEILGTCIMEFMN